MMINLLTLFAWGWFNQHWIVAAILSLLIVNSALTPWKWALKVEQFYRIGDFVTVLFVVAIVYFSLAHNEQRPVFIILEWLPVFFLPVLLLQLYSANNQLPMGTLFYSVRKREPVNYLDFRLPYAAICLLAAGAVKDASLTYFMVSIIGFSGILWTVRSKNNALILWFLVMVGATGLSYWGQQSLRHFHQLAEEKAIEWITQWHADPFRSQTSIGDIGELKLSDKIEFRVDATEPLLLMQASYDRYLGASWLASMRIFNDRPNYVAPDNRPVKQLNVFQSLKHATILALPAGVAAIKGLAGATLQYTPLGAVKLSDAPDFVNYQIDYTGQQTGKVWEFDLEIPPQHQGWIVTIKQELKLEQQSPQAIAQAIKQYFQTQYYYTLFLGKESDANKALEDFMLKRKAGHCEYFAVASVLLLRSYGIPARLANGYAVQEYSDVEQLYIVRRRHAHAWAIAHIEGVWRAVDATPAQWLDIEEQQAELWQPVYDFFSAAYFKYKQWRYQQAMIEEESDDTLLWLSVDAVLLIILVWRLYVTRHLLQTNNQFNSKVSRYDEPGQDSELYLIEQALAMTAQARRENESVAVWVQRLDDPTLIDIAKMHYQYRFDSGAFSSDRRRELKQSVQRWLKKDDAINRV